MNDRSNRRPAHQQRADRLAAALRANLKRRKAQARGRHGQARAAEGDENGPKHAHSEGERRGDG